MYKRENIGCEKFTFLKIKYISEFSKMWTPLKFEGQIKTLPNINAKLFQTFNVKSLKTAMVMESVMVPENVNAMTIGNQKQTALVTILNWIWLDYSSTGLFFIPCQMKQNSFRVCLQRSFWLQWKGHLWRFKMWLSTSMGFICWLSRWVLHQNWAEKLDILS